MIINGQETPESPNDAVEQQLASLGLAYATNANEVARFHRDSDVDFDSQSQHHTLGKGPNQAAAGNHLHDDRYYTEQESDNRFAPLRPTAIFTRLITSNNNTANAAWTVLQNWGTGAGLGDFAGHYSLALGNLTVLVDGWYRIYFRAGFAPSVAGTIRANRIRLNGITTLARDNGNILTGGSNGSARCEWEGPLTAGQVVTLDTYQDTGGILAVVPGEAESIFSIRKIVY